MTDELNAVALEPCPFCGGSARVTYSDRGEIFSVRCNNWTGDAGSTSCMGSGAYAHTENEAIAAWNRRALPPLSAPVTSDSPPEQSDVSHSRPITYSKEWEVVGRLLALAKVGWGYDINPRDRTALKQAAALITALVAERDEAMGTLKYCEAQWSDERGTMIDKMQAARAEAARLREALVKLAAEVAGLAAFEAQVRAIIGNTNWAVLQQRLDAARTALET